MVATQASPPPPYRDIELGAPPPYAEATSRPPPYVPNEPATRLTIDDLVISIQTEPVSRVDEVPATTSQPELRIQNPESEKINFGRL
uniref:Uncharacterized protein n=1 Tax=Acrobeloides nanus TaxID=290746 RepID=A0A914DUJ0_9BILA